MKGMGGGAGGGCGAEYEDLDGKPLLEEREKGVLHEVQCEIHVILEYSQEN